MKWQPERLEQTLFSHHSSTVIPFNLNNIPQQLGLSLSYFLQQMKLPYLIWKRRSWTILGYQKNQFFYKIAAIYGSLNIPHFSMFSWCAGVNQHPSTFWSITLQPLGGDQATIPHMKGDILSFHKRHISLTCYWRLRGKIKWNPLPFFPLVLKWIWTWALYRLEEMTNMTYDVISSNIHLHTRDRMRVADSS